jgi:hypothetical protein
MATQSVTIKRGATLSLAGYVNLPSGSWSAASETRDQSGALVDDLTVTLTAPVSPSIYWTLLIGASATATAIWPVGPLSCDVRFTDGVNVLYTPTFAINVVQEITDV